MFTVKLKRRESPGFGEEIQEKEVTKLIYRTRMELIPAADRLHKPERIKLA